MGLQVDLLTKGKSCHAKEFIDFEFNGKHISEFGLVVVSDGDRLSFDASPEFEDESSEVSGADGQLYWGTRYKTRKYEYNLATDGMTEQQLNDFKRHFQPGTYGKLVEDSRTYRYCYCRLESVANFQIVPFKKKTTIMGYSVEVDEYKGEATISFIQDDPYIYSTINYFEEQITDQNYQTVLRGVHDNNIPLPGSWTAEIDNQYSSALGTMLLGTDPTSVSKDTVYPVCFLGANKALSYNGSSSELKDLEYYIPQNYVDPMIYYNSSTKCSKVFFELHMQPAITAFQNDPFIPVYFSNIADDINVYKMNGAEPYNRIESSDIQVMNDGVIVIPNPMVITSTMKYTNPNVIYSIHRAIKIAFDFKKSGNNNLKDLENSLMETIIHPQIAKRVAEAINYIKAQSQYYNEGILQAGTIQLSTYLYNKTSESFDADWFAYFNTYMLGYFANVANLPPEQYSNPVFQPYDLYIDGQSSMCKISYLRSQMKDSEIISVLTEENCGDIMLSDYIQLDGGDKINSDGKIASCHCLRFINGGNFTNHPNVHLIYKYTFV